MNIRAVDLNLLVVMEALLAKGSVTAASKSLALSQSATSHALSRLRDLFADPLFVRHGSHLVPTARAEALRDPLRSALDTIRGSIAGSPVFDPKTSDRTFTMWMGDLGEYLFLPHLVAYLATHAPRVNLVAVPIAGDGPEPRLADGSLDVALGPMGPKGARFRRETLAKDGFVCVLRAGHRALRKRWDLDAYCAESHLVVAPRGASGSMVDTWLASKGKGRRVALTVPNFLVAPPVVAASDLVWTAPERVARGVVRLLDVAIRPTPVAMAAFPIDLIWHQRHDGDPGHTFLREAFRWVATSAFPQKRAR